MFTTKVNMYPEVPSSSQVSDDIDNDTHIDEVAAFVRKWSAAGLSPPITLAKNLRAWISSNTSPGSPLVLDDRMLSLTTMIWNTAAEHYTMIGKSQVNRMSSLIDQLGEISGRKPPQGPAFDMPPPPPKRKHPDSLDTNPILGLIGQDWDDNKDKHWREKPADKKLLVLNWVLHEYLGVLTKPVTIKWITDNPASLELGAVSAYALKHQASLSDCDKEALRALVVQTVKNTPKRPCLD
uniref:Phosphoprotein n=1 Tax=Dichorhavirus orchidaceae TaxID=152177 RepID=A0A1P8J7T1_9RHAB|nr:phosphoprotein [Dichorhavirus orchidaceae]QDM58729.1 putative phosphoprotein [Dichorhavirus orchidaceae]UVK68533.1 ORF2 protein [Dichorhavirus orchidaceae]